MSSWLFYVKKIATHLLRIGTSFLLDPTLSTDPKPHLQKTWHVSIHVILLNLGLGTPCSMLSIVEIAWIDLKWVETWTWNLVWTGPKKVSIYIWNHSLLLLRGTKSWFNNCSCPRVKNSGPLLAQAKGHNYGIVRALSLNQKAVPWDMRKPFCIETDLVCQNLRHVYFSKVGPI